MIIGLDRFREFFKGFEEQYVLIGGVAAMQWLESAGLRPRATKDFDIVLIVERLNDQFLARFWEFVRSGRYGNLQRSTGKRIYYRFMEPQEDGYPYMLEIFSRKPDELSILGDATIVPVPAEEDASSLSAILMDDGYYALVKNNRANLEGLPLLAPEGLILLKARAWLDLAARKQEGKPVDDRDIRKHRSDVFKLALLLPQDRPMTISESVREDLLNFLRHFPADSPEWESIRQSSGIPKLMPPPAELIEIIRRHYVSAPG
ncbi:MAG: hypothetical protein NTX50_05845 [Candidatus Sumerlaeota bacterium]|nr:hypothetical protein [Candidatus Sumerlaeota bacterium]